MSRSLTPRPGVSRAPAAKVFSRLRGHANWPGVQACLRFSRRQAPYLPGTIVHNTRAVAALQTRCSHPYCRSAAQALIGAGCSSRKGSSGLDALRARVHRGRMLFAQGFIGAGCSSRKRSSGPDALRASAHRRSMPVASRITMSVNTTSVSMPFIAPVISSRTNPCIADQNSSAA